MRRTTGPSHRLPLIGRSRAVARTGALAQTTAPASRLNWRYSENSVVMAACPQPPDGGGVDAALCFNDSAYSGLGRPLESFWANANGPC